MSLSADRAAVRAVRSGDHEAFGRLVDSYQGRLFGLILVMIRDPSGADDVTQAAFVRAFTHLDRYDESRPFYPWLATIGVRLAQNWLARRNRIATREGTPIDPERDASRDSGPLNQLIDNERQRRVWRAVAALPLGQRTAVVMYYRQEMKVAEVARALGVASGTVKTLLFRARRRLRALLQDPVKSTPEETK